MVEDYRYDTFRAALLLNDARFSPDSLKPGQGLPDRTLVRADGAEISLRQLAGGQPVVLVTGSLTCPLTISSLPLLGEMNRLYGDRVIFAFVYTREAHPGENVRQPVPSRRRSNMPVCCRRSTVWTGRCWWTIWMALCTEHWIPSRTPFTSSNRTER